MDWFYDDGNQLKPYLEDCKRFSSSSNCTLCGEFNNPLRVLNVDTGVQGQVKCSEVKNFQLDQFEYQFNPFGYLRCPPTTY